MCRRWRARTRPQQLAVAAAEAPAIRGSSNAPRAGFSGGSCARGWCGDRRAHTRTVAARHDLNPPIDCSTTRLLSVFGRRRRRSGCRLRAVGDGTHRMAAGWGTFTQPITILCISLPLCGSHISAARAAPREWGECALGADSAGVVVARRRCLPYIDVYLCLYVCICCSRSTCVQAGTFDADSVLFSTPCSRAIWSGRTSAI